MKKYSVRIFYTHDGKNLHMQEEQFNTFEDAWHAANLVADFVQEVQIGSPDNKLLRVIYQGDLIYIAKERA